MSDAQDEAEQFDEDATGMEDPILSDEFETDRASFPPDELQGVPFADADVTDESFAERTAAEIPDEGLGILRIEPTDDASAAADEQLEQIVEIPPD